MELLNIWVKFIDKWGFMYLEGAIVTLQISIIGLFIGLLMGLMVAFFRMSKNRIIYSLLTLYVEIIRGTPLLVQVMIVYYGLSSIIPDEYGWLKSRFALTTLAICLNSSAYISEIVRSGIQSVDKGQMEAARSLGMTSRQAMRHIIVPQAVKIVLPAFGNEFVTLIKETAIVSFVGIGDIMQQAKVVSGSSYKYFMSYLMAAFIYFVMVFGLSQLLRKYERRLKVSDTGN